MPALIKLKRAGVNYHVNIAQIMSNHVSPNIYGAFTEMAMCRPNCRVYVTDRGLTIERNGHRVNYIISNRAELLVETVTIERFDGVSWNVTCRFVPAVEGNLFLFTNVPLRIPAMNCDNETERNLVARVFHG